MDENHLSQYPHAAPLAIFHIPDQTVLRSPFPRHIYQASAARSSAFTPPKANHTLAFTSRNNSPTNVTPNYNHLESSQTSPPATLPVLVKPTPVFPQITVSPSSFFGDRNGSLLGTLQKSTEFNAAAATPHHSWDSPFELDLNGVAHAPLPVQGFNNGHEHISTFPTTARSLSVEYDKTQVSIDQLYNSTGGAQNGLGFDSAAKEKFDYLSMTSPMPKIVDQVRLNIVTPQTTFKIPPSPQHINGSVHRSNFNSSASTPPLQTTLSKSSPSPMFRTPKQPSVRELNFMYTASGNSSAQFFPPIQAYCPKSPTSEHGYSLPRSANGPSSVDPAHLAYTSRENNRTKPNPMNEVAASASAVSAVVMTKSPDTPEVMDMDIGNPTTALATDFGGSDDAYETDITAAQTYSGLGGMGSTDMYQARIPPGFALPPPRLLPHAFTSLVSYDPHPSDDEQGNSNEQGNNNEFEEFVNLSPHVGAEDAFYSPARKFGELQRGSSPELAGMSNNNAKDDIDVVTHQDEEPIEEAAEVLASANTMVADSPASPVPTPSPYARVADKSTLVAKEPDKMEPKILDSDVIHLVQWRLKTGVRQEESVILVSGLHTDSKKQLKSNEIVERIDAHTLRSCTGKIYRIAGHPDVQEMLLRGISHTLCEAFRDGFPENWKQLVWDELENIGRSSAISSPAMKTPSRSEAMSSDLWDTNTNNGWVTRLSPLSATAKRLKLAQETPTRYSRRRNDDVATGNISMGKSPVLTSMARKLAAAKEDVVDITPLKTPVPNRRKRGRPHRPRPLSGSSNGNVIASRGGNKPVEGDAHETDDEADGEEGVVDTAPQKMSASSLRNKERAPRSRVIKSSRKKSAAESEKSGHRAGEADGKDMIGVTPQKTPGSNKRNRERSLQSTPITNSCDDDAIEYGKKPAEDRSCRTNQSSDEAMSKQLSWSVVKARMREVVVEIPFYPKRVMMKVKEMEEVPHGETKIETEYQSQIEDQGAEEANAEETNAEETNAEEANAEETSAEETSAEEVSVEAASAETESAEEVNAAEANAEEVNAEEVNAEEVNVEEANVEKANVEKANVEKAKVEKANVEEANVEEVNVEEANVKETNAEETKVERANVEEANVEEANVEEANVEEANVEEANVEDANVDEANVEEANVEEANVEEANVEEANVEEANVEEANVEEANVEEANVEEANVEEANVEKANVEEANVEEANVEEANVEEANVEEANVEEVNVEKANVEEANVEEANVEEANVEEEDADADKVETQRNLKETRDDEPAEAESVTTFGEKHVIAEDVAKASMSTNIEPLNKPTDNTPADSIIEEIGSAEDDVQPARPDNEDVSGNNVDILSNSKRTEETERKANFMNLPKTRRYSVSASEDRAKDADVEDETLTRKRKAPRRTVKEHSEPPNKRRLSVQIKNSPATRSGRNVKPPAAWWEVKLESKDDIKRKEYPVKKRKLGRPKKERVDTPSLLLPSRSQDTVSIMVELSGVKTIEKDEESPMLSANEFTFPVENDERIRLLEKSESGHELGEGKLKKTVGEKNSVTTKNTNDKLPKRKQKIFPCLKEGRRRRKSGGSVKEQLKHCTNEKVNEDEVLVEDHGETSHDTAPAPKEANEGPPKENGTNQDRENDDWDFEHIYGDDDPKTLLAQTRVIGSSKEFSDSATYDPYDPDTYINEVTVGNGIRPGTPTGKKPKIYRTPASSKRLRQGQGVVTPVQAET
ncbi:hypothetical protein BC937DRAFT_91533 [Endogone sp. FLAS-F59071]|nr:hypothetical protein BC937DRAFT_91533 [Endogone sp. FLAS-F59071]|eukprot:RUS21745.1 hypothetical protein BC937DRAFT_91533 [Endogone sp. FLAS-F59071]